MGIPYDVFSVIFIIGFLAGIILSVVFFFKKGNRSANRIFSAFLLASLISFLYAVLWPTKWYVSLPHLILIRYPAMYLIGPLFLFYVQALIRGGRSFRRRDALHFLPALACLLVMMPFYLRSAEYKIRFIEASAQRTDLEFNLLFFFAYLQVLFYFLWANRLIRDYTRRIREEFSGREPAQLEWIRNLSGMILVIYLFCLPLFALILLGRDAEQAINYSYLIALLLYFSVLFSGYRVWVQPELVSLPAPAEKKEKYRKSKISREESGKYYARLTELMEKDKAYLDPELNLSDLASRLDLNPRYLSQVINENAGMNFYDFINRFRVEEARKAIADPGQADRDILTIAFDSGFRSKATFNALFKKYTKLTPSQFRKTQ